MKKLILSLEMDVFNFGLANVLSAMHDLFRDLKDELLAENASPVEIAQSIVRDAEIMTRKLK